MSTTNKLVCDDASYLVHIGFIRKERADMHVVTQGQQFSSQKWALIEVHIGVVPDQTQSSQ